MEKSSLTRFKDEVRFAISKARKPLVWIETFDYSYMLDIICSIGRDGWIWNESSGIVNDLRTKAIFKVNNQAVLRTDTLSDSIKNISTQPTFSILVARVTNLLFSTDQKLISTLQDFVYDNNQEGKTNKQTIVLVSNAHIEVTGLEHICERFILPLPDIEDIDEEFGFIQDAKLRTVRDEHPEVHPDDDRILEFNDDLKDLIIPENEGNEISYKLINNRKGIIRRDNNGRIERILLPQVRKYRFGGGFLCRIIEKNSRGEKIETTLETRYQELVESLSGMHLYDIKELLGSIMVKGDGKIKSRNLTKTIRDRKKQIANNSGLLEVIDYDKDYWEKVADIDNLLKHIDSEKARIDNPSNYPPKLPKPKGILLVGAPGCGKSESAKAIASKLDKPLYRLNIGSLLGHKYGQSENRFIEALRTADASAPCVLWIDEIEKAFAGAGNESENDDTLTHIVGHFLTWMQEHKTMVYLVATANDVSRMKPEMLRKGRWDETFYLNYPSLMGCKTILKTISETKFETKLKNLGKEISIDTLANVMCSIPMSGAEIENTIADTIKNHSKVENGTWCVYMEDLAYTLVNNYLMNKEGIIVGSIDKKEIENHNYSYMANLFKTYCDKKNSDANKDGTNNNDLFLKTKVDKEILEMRIQNFGRITDDDMPNLRILLMEKYKKQYNFKSASITL